MSKISTSHIRKIMVERDTGRPRGFGFLTFADRRGMEDAIREMHGREFGDCVISVNKAQPRMGGDDPGHGYSDGYPSGGRGSYGGGDRSIGQDDCFKCGCPGHWARDCPSAGGGGRGDGFSSRSRFGGPGGRGDHFGGYCDRYIDDRYPSNGGRFVADRYGGVDRYPQNGHEKDAAYDRDGGPRGRGDRYGGGGGPARYKRGKILQARTSTVPMTAPGGVEDAHLLLIATENFQTSCGLH